MTSEDGVVREVRDHRTDELIECEFCRDDPEFCDCGFYIRRATRKIVRRGGKAVEISEKPTREIR